MSLAGPAARGSAVSFWICGVAAPSENPAVLKSDLLAFAGHCRALRLQEVITPKADFENEQEQSLPAFDCEA